MPARRRNQEQGRVAAEANPEAITYLLLGALYQRVYWRELLGQAADPEADSQFIERLLETLTRVLSPER